jgi:predicted phage terminase large subunit-like protein
VDDPVKGRAEAESDVIRKRTIEAFDDDVKTRLKPGGSIILIQTRWHEEDLAGSILPEGYNGESGVIHCRDGQDWEVICLPAKAERADDPLGRAVGDYLWPEWFDRRHWAQFESKPRTWASLYQQRPAPEEGDLFKAEWLKPYSKEPARDTLQVYGASDYAVTADGGDYTVHIVAGIDVEGRIYLLDLWRKQTSSDQWVEAFCDLVLHWKPMGWAEETGQIKAGVGPFLEKRMRERKAYVVRETFPTRGDKAVRAQSIRGRMALDGLYVPSTAPWFEQFRSELLTFPTGRNDDQVDALGLLGQLLDVMFKNPPSKEDEEPKNKSGYTSRADRAEPDDWMTA